MAFAVARGFVERYRMVEWEVDPPNFDFDGHPARAIPDGLRITTLAEVDGPAVRHALHEMLLEATADVPTPDAVPPSSYDEWQRELFGMPRFAAEGLILAMERGRPVAACCVTVDGLNAWTHFTAVARSHRGRGLAWNVKLASLRLTRERGVRSLRTTNHTANAGMLAINEGLGFRRVPGTVRYGRDL